MDKNPVSPSPIEHDPAEGLSINEKEEPLIHGLHVVIRFCVRILAVLMTLVIMWSVADVACYVECCRCSLGSFSTCNDTASGITERQ